MIGQGHEHGTRMMSAINEAQPYAIPHRPRSVACILSVLGIRFVCKRRDVARVDQARNEALQQHAPYQANSLRPPLRICAFQVSSQ